MSTPKVIMCELDPVIRASILGAIAQDAPSKQFKGIFLASNTLSSHHGQTNSEMNRQLDFRGVLLLEKQQGSITRPYWTIVVNEKVLAKR